MFRVQRLLLIGGIVIVCAAVYQLFALPYENYISIVSHWDENKVFNGPTRSNNSDSVGRDLLNGPQYFNNASRLYDKSKEESKAGSSREHYDTLNDEEEMESLEAENVGTSSRKFTSEWSSSKDLTLADSRIMEINSKIEKFAEVVIGSLGQFKKSDINSSKDNSTTSVPSLTENTSSAQAPNHKPVIKAKSNHVNTAEDVLIKYNLSMVTNNPLTKEMGMKLMSAAYMMLLSHQTSFPTNFSRPRWPSARDRELQHARSQIENARVIQNAPGLNASLFRNISTFKKSYDVMEKIFKVYVYKEGEKPIFHQPHLRGIYASEGWFMKLMEGNKQIVVRDPRKAHLFYLPFSSLKLRRSLYGKSFLDSTYLENQLESFVGKIAKKYRFWNRTRGADHFLVACHDWAPRLTEKAMGSCIRALCNSNLARGFNIGNDVSLPVTSVRSSSDPQEDIGGNHPSRRSILAFFAGQMHGHIRPILLRHWNNKAPDMKIFGPMPRDVDGKARYRELMKSSKYCICARGYEVHTPRVVESIHYECVPVIISDNYVPPFYEILNWEAFSVFVPEKHVPNLRNILLSIPEEKYLDMQNNVKMVQQHFLWHKKPVRYDLFHMILHSIWYRRVLQVNPG